MEKIVMLTELCDAIQRHDLDELKRKLAEGVDPNGILSSGTRAVMNEAATAGFLEGLEVLHAAGGLIDGTPAFGITPLMSAVNRGQIATVRWLLQHGANAQAESARVGIPFEHALKIKNIDCAKAILQERPDLMDFYASKIKEKLIKYRDPDVVHWLLQIGIDPNIVDNSGNTWLILAQSSMIGSVPLTRLLLDAGAKVNLQGKNGSTALHHAVFHKALPAFMQLLQSGADPDVANNQGFTVRNVIKSRTEMSHLHDALTAWEASTAAQKVISGHQVPTGIKPI